MSRTRVIKGSKVIPYVVSRPRPMGFYIWPIHWPIPGHCTYGKLYLFWINIAVQLIWAHFQWDRTILKIWPLYERSLTFYPFIPLSWQRNIVWISCNWLFYSLWREEEFEICFNLIGAFLSFIPIITFDLGFHGQNAVWKNVRHVCLVGRTFLCILIHEFPNTNKMGTGFWSETYRLTLFPVLRFRQTCPTHYPLTPKSNSL